jgi:hypothetical protein
MHGRLQTVITAFPSAANALMPVAYNVNPIPPPNEFEIAAGCVVIDVNSVEVQSHLLVVEHVYVSSTSAPLTNFITTSLTAAAV